MINMSRSTQNPNKAIVIEGLGKRYAIGRHRASSKDGMRHAIEAAVRAPLAWMKRRGAENRRETDFWALRDVSFSIDHGEVVGIVGRNGAGKSTLLKILSRITEPTEGKVSIDGRIASLLEVGTGFHQELTGRENIFLNGAILGMKRTEIIRKFDEIVAFSEVEDFLDTPVKRYSSGMYVRLAFAVAAHLEPEILIVDEVLAVGDSAFQRKCLGKMGSFAQSGRTVLFVSHNLEAVLGLCQRAVWMKDGRVEQDGEVHEVADAYQRGFSVENSFSCTNADYGLTVDKVKLRDEKGDECNVFSPGEDLTVEISYTAEKRIESPIVALGVIGPNGSCFTSNMLLDGHRPEFLKGSGKISCTFRSIPLLPQDFSIRLRIQAADPSEVIIPYQDVAFFSVTGDLSEYGYQGEYLKFARRATSVVVPHEWRLPDGKTATVSLAHRPELTNSASYRDRTLAQ
jgi:lipopolysaccharide transport system ATP-binding protein